MENTRLQLLFVMVYHRDQLLDQYFLFCTHSLYQIQHYPVFHQIYADDTQICKSCKPSEIVDTINSIEQCISNVKTWMFHNKLQMNDDKTETILFARKGLATEHLPKSIKIGDTAINFVPMLRDLVVTLDSSLSFN